MLDSVISLASMASNVYVQDLSDSADEVRATISTGLSVNHLITIAIALAGGFTSVARQGKVTLIRGNKMQYLDLAKLYDEIENLRRDVDLLPGDIVFVRQSFW